LGSEAFFLQVHKLVGQGRADGVHRSAVGFLFGKKAQAALREYKPVSDRLIGITLRTVTGTATILQVYAQTSADTDADIDLFYTNLQRLLSGAKPQDIIIVMGDLNAMVGSDRSAARTVVGPLGLGSSNEREQLTHFCNVNSLVTANTFFRQSKVSRLWTWELPDGVIHNQIDYSIVNRRW
jgi:hypothetical protein